MLAKNNQLYIEIEKMQECPEKTNLCRQISRTKLEKYGIFIKLASEKKQEKTDEGFLVTAKDSIGQKIVASLFLVFANNSAYLPIERIIEKLTGSIPHWRTERAANTFAEMTSCWVNCEYKGLGLPYLMMRLAIAAAIEYQLEYIFTFHNNITAKHVKKLGFSVIESFGNKGHFFYPDERYVSILTGLDIKNWEQSMPVVDHPLLQKLMKEPRVNCVDSWGENKVEIEYCSDQLLVKQPY